MKKAVQIRLIKRVKDMDRFMVNLRFRVRVNLEMNEYMDLIYYFQKNPTSPPALDFRIKFLTIPKKLS